MVPRLQTNMQAGGLRPKARAKRGLERRRRRTSGMVEAFGATRRCAAVSFASATCKASCKLPVSHAPGRSPLSAWVGPKCAPSAPRSCWQPAAARLTAPQRRAVADPNPASAALSRRWFRTLIAQSRWHWQLKWHLRARSLPHFLHGAPVEPSALDRSRVALCESQIFVWRAAAGAASVPVRA